MGILQLSSNLDSVLIYLSACFISIAIDVRKAYLKMRVPILTKHGGGLGHTPEKGISPVSINLLKIQTFDSIKYNLHCIRYEAFMFTV